MSYCWYIVEVVCPCCDPIDMVCIIDWDILYFAGGPEECFDCFLATQMRQDAVNVDLDLSEWSHGIRYGAL